MIFHTYTQMNLRLRHILATTLRPLATPLLVGIMVVDVMGVSGVYSYTESESFSGADTLYNANK